MKYVTKDDWFEIRLASVLSDYDRQILNVLYQPLIGYASLAVYFTLWSEYAQNNYHDLFSHDHLFDYMQISPGEFLKARMRLEAIGLLQTFFKSENGVNYYTYLLNAPKYPHDFFEDPLFAGLYEKYVGVKEAERVARSFTLNSHSLSKGMSDISASFIEVFHPNLDDDLFIKATTLASGKKSRRIAGDVRSEFDFGTFFATMKSKYGFSEKCFTTKDRKEIERVAILFGFDGERMAEVVNRTYMRDEDGNASFRLDLLKKYCQEEIKFPSIEAIKGTKSSLSSSSKLAEKIRYMESLSCYEYLRVKQDMRDLVPSDLSLLERLSSKLGLPSSVINALIDYVLETNDNKLPSSLTEKIGASLMRAKISNALDAMNYLHKSHYRPTKEIQETEDIEPEDIESEEEKPVSQDKKDDEIPLEELEDLLSKI